MSGLTGSGIQLDTETKVDTSTGDHDRYSHYAPKDEITYALIYGVPIMALCGKIWIPSRDPKGFTICPTCKEVYEAMNYSSEDYLS